MTRPIVTITLTNPNGDVDTVRVRSVLGPFVIHRPAFKRKANHWVITHTRTGKIVLRVRTLAKAQEIAAQLMFVHSWRFTEDEFNKHRETIRPFIEAIQDRYAAEIVPWQKA